MKTETKFTFIVRTTIKSRTYDTETASLEYAKHLALKDQKAGHKVEIFRKSVELKAIDI